MSLKKTSAVKLPKTVLVELTSDQLLLLSEALDSHIYWQLSDEQYRNNGFVNEPGSDDEENAQSIVEAEQLQTTLDNLKNRMG